MDQKEVCYSDTAEHNLKEWVSRPGNHIPWIDLWHGYHRVFRAEQIGKDHSYFLVKLCPVYSSF